MAGQVHITVGSPYGIPAWERGWVWMTTAGSHTPDLLNAIQALRLPALGPKIWLVSTCQNRSAISNLHLAGLAPLVLHLLDTGRESELVWLNLGNVRLEQGRINEAQAAYRRALRAVALGGPDPYLTLDTLGRIHRAIGHCEEA